MTTSQFFKDVYDCLIETNVTQKCLLTRQLYQKYDTVLKLQGIDFSVLAVEDGRQIPGVPSKPIHVAPAKVKKRGLGSDRGRATFIHSIAHIEFNAINLALDAAWRFRGMPTLFYRDWLDVAAEEAQHFGLLQNRLQELGFDYGDFTAHNGLWEMAEDTAHDVMTRMALVPRVLEARGLDITPLMMEKLSRVGDVQTVKILETILNDEIRHVGIGSHWFHYCCAQKDVAPMSTFLSLINQYLVCPPKSPFNDEARDKAGFSAEEIEALLEMEQRWLVEVQGQHQNKIK